MHMEAREPSSTSSTVNRFQFSGKMLILSQAEQFLVRRKTPQKCDVGWKRKHVKKSLRCIGPEDSTEAQVRTDQNNDSLSADIRYQVSLESSRVKFALKMHRRSVPAQYLRDFES